MEQQEWGIPGAGRRLRHIYVSHVHGPNVNKSTCPRAASKYINLLKYALG